MTVQDLMAKGEVMHKNVRDGLDICIIDVFLKKIF